MKRLHTLLPVAVLVASPVFAGWSITQVVTTEGARGDGGTDGRQKLWLDGNSAKIEFESSDNPMMPRGAYLLVRDGGRSIVLVNPGERTYAPLNPAAMGSGMDAMGGGAMEMKVEDPKVEKLLEEPGGVLLGRETTHYRYHTAYTTTIAMATMKSAITTDVVEDVWTAPAIPFGGAAQRLGDLDGGTSAEIAELERQARAGETGLPLRRVVVAKTSTSSKGGLGGGMLMRLMSAGKRKGAVDEATTTTVVETVTEVALAPSFFQIPPGYAETEPMQRGPAMPDLGGGRQ